MWRRNMHSLRGMTLVEVLVTVAVLSLVMVVASDAVLSLYKTNSTGTRAVVQIGSARYALATMMQELRQAAYGTNGSYPILSMSPSSLTFFSNITNGTQALRIQYQLTGTKLTRSAVAPGTPPTYGGTPTTADLATYMHNTAGGVTLFRYFDEEGAEITDMNQTDDVASIAVAVSILAPGMTTPFLLTATTTLRNLKGL